MKVVTNATVMPKRYFGLHMVEGVAEYREPEQMPYRIFIGEEAIKNMDPSFEGRPVFVRHVDEVDLKNIQNEADGFVVRSFFNPADGKHWVEFLIVSDKGHNAIRNGWKLSNAYIPKEFAGGGQWHGVDYAKEVRRGEYEHLAIVPNPRYSESVIMTPEEFKLYNEDKELELKRLANSKGEEPMLQFFKKAKVENSADLEGTVVVLPKSKVEKSVLQLVNEMDDYQLKMKEPQMANGEHHVMVGEHKMSVNELVAKHMAACNELEEMKKKHPMENKEDEADKDAHAAEAKGEGELVPNEEEEKKKKENEGKEDMPDQKAAEKKSNDKKNFDALKNAPNDVVKNETKPVDLGEDKVKRGKARYGSN